VEELFNSLITTILLFLFRNLKNLNQTNFMVSEFTAGCWFWLENVKYQRVSSLRQQLANHILSTFLAILVWRAFGTTETAG
jgi:hypothetical protein